MPGAARTSDFSPPPGRFRVSRFGELDSTNHWVLERAREGAADGLVAVADHQTAGRGRLDRAWDAPPGSSLLVSVLVKTPGPASGGGIESGATAAHGAVTAAAVAMVQAVREVTGVSAGVKWPNDVVVGDRKLAGILAEQEGTTLVIGVGCNVNWDAFPPELAETATACNLEAGAPVDRDALLDAFLARLGYALDQPEETARAHLDALVTIGRRVRVTRLREAPLVGEATGLAADGALEVRDDTGAVHHVTVGDVVHLRPA